MMVMIIFVTGRQPEISYAELAAVYGRPLQLLDRQLVAVNMGREETLRRFDRLGSVVKVMEVVTSDFVGDAKHRQELLDEVFGNVEGKITLGVSDYRESASVKTALTLGKSLKGAVKAAGHSVRMVPQKEAIVSTATLLHNGMARGNSKKVELNFLKKNIVAKTLAVQDIDSYAARDRSRPYRDAHNGMLPPKLARIMVNLAAGARGNRRDRGQVKNTVVLDPFCGTGVALQEAALLGAKVYGTDLNPEMAKYTKGNLNWLAKTRHLDVDHHEAAGDATNFDWKRFVGEPIDLVVSETYLGKPYTSTPSVAEVKRTAAAVDTIISKFLRNLSHQIPTGAGLCIAVPAWFVRDHITHLPLTNHLHEYGFTNKSSGANLIYHRPDQVVGRELLVLTKSHS